jgi:hypothetical protein
MMSTSTNVSGIPAAAPTVIKHRSAAVEAPRAFTLDEEPVQTQQPRPSAEKDQGEQAISEDEKQYFAGLFPTAADAIRSYSPYQKNGMKRSAGIGTLVDVKG